MLSTIHAGLRARIWHVVGKLRAVLPFLTAPGCILCTSLRLLAAAGNDGPDRDVAAGGSASGPDFANVRTVGPDWTKDVQGWLVLSGFYYGYLRNYAQRTMAKRRCLEGCRLDNNRSVLGDAWNVACKAERENFCKSLQCTKCEETARAPSV